MAEIPQKRDFLTWSIQNFVRKVKLMDLTNKLFDEKKLLISFYAICYQKLSRFIKKPVE